jgi:peptidoglycan/LPS O-acetylase OafA/YrhL
MPSARQPFSAIDFKTRFPALDGIRALAVTMVFALHFGGGGTNGGPILKALNSIRELGGFGVDIFFVLSGFLITGILFDTRRDSRFFKRFFARRSLRIFPIVYLLFAILALLTPIMGYQWHWQQAFFLVYLGNFFANAHFDYYLVHATTHPAAEATLAHLWSLCVEEQFYLVWPLVVWLIGDRVKLLWTSIALCVLALALRIAMVHVLPLPVAVMWLYRTLPFRLDDLVMGAALALLLRGAAADAVQRSMKWVFLAGLTGTAASYFYSPDAGSAWGITGLMTLVGITSFGLIGMTLRPGSPAYSIFNLRPLRVLGKYSYGFYVWHIVWGRAWIQVLVYMTARFHSTAIGGAVSLSLAFIATFLAAKLSYDLYEVRFLKWKYKFEYDSEIREHKTAFALDGN